MIPAQLTRAEQAAKEALQRRYDAAQMLELARQVARESGKYGYLTQQHVDAVAAANQVYEQETAVARWVVITR